MPPAPPTSGASLFLVEAAGLTTDPPTGWAITTMGSGGACGRTVRWGLPLGGATLLLLLLQAAAVQESPGSGEDLSEGARVLRWGGAAEGVRGTGVGREGKGGAGFWCRAGGVEA